MPRVYLPGYPDLLVQSAYAQARRFLRRRYVTGVSIGRAVRRGITGELAVCIHVEQKLPVRVLGKAQRFPKEIGGLPVDVVELKHSSRSLPEAEKIARRVTIASPVVPGVALAPASGEIGTIGMVVVDALSATRDRCVLTAAHVLTGPISAAVFQPEQGQAPSLLGHIRRRVRSGNCDAAIAVLDAGRPAENAPFLGNGVVVNGIREVRAEDVLTKSGCMTGVTRAKVSHIGEFTIDDSNGQAIVMQGMTLRPVVDGDTAEISDAGDSGSVWYDATTGEAVGLCVAGDKLGVGDKDEWAFACHLTSVFSELNVALA